MSDAVRVAAVWRYPVKSMGGQSLPSVQVNPDGVQGDREWAFESSAAPAGMLRVGGQERASLLAWQARGLGHQVRVRSAAGEFSVEDAALIPALGWASQVRLTRAQAPQTDCRPLALVSLETIAALGAEVGVALDPRRFRANFYLQHAGAFAEDAWVGRRLRLGAEVVVEITERDPRCRFFALDPESGTLLPELMKVLDRRHQGRAGVYARVVQGGVVRAGDPVAIQRA